MDRPKYKILFITFEYENYIAGGIGRVLNGIGLLLQNKVDLQILHIKDRCDAFLISGNNRERKFLIGFRFHQRLINLIRAEKYDVVHIFHVTRMVAEMAKIVKQNFPEIKLIYSCHSLFKHESGIRNNRPEFIEYENTIFSKVDHIHLLNQSSLKNFQAAYPLMTSQLSYSIIPNGIDENQFQKRDLTFEEKLKPFLKGLDKIKVLYVARWVQGKGLEYLLDAIPKVVARNSNIQFILAGRKTDSWEYQYKRYLRKINKKLYDLVGYVIPLGWLSDERRNSLFAMGDIWVMPSLLEYFPYSILEPMSAKIPIISSRIDCVQEILTEGDECLFYEPTDSDQLAERILELAEDPVLRGRLAEKAYQKAKKYYQWDEIAELYYQMYQDILEQRMIV